MTVIWTVLRKPRKTMDLMGFGHKRRQVISFAQASVKHLGNKATLNEGHVDEGANERNH